MKRKGLSFYDSQHLQKMLVQQNENHQSNAHKTSYKDSYL